MTTVTKWFRHRFKADASDYRPMTFPPPGPYWCTGYGDDYSTVVVLLPEGVDPSDDSLWPEAADVDTEGPYDAINFTSRFPEPDWWADHPNNYNRKEKQS